MKYYNLSVHSCYDLLNSTIKLEELFSKLRDNGVDSVCISDPNMYGAIKSYKLSAKYGINLIHALEVTTSHDLDFTKFNIISKNEKMFKVLCKLSSIIQTEYSEITTEFLFDFLQEYKEDFILLVVSEFSSLANANELTKKLNGFDYYFGYNENFNYNIYGNIKKIVYVKESNYLNKYDYQPLVVVRAIKNNSKLKIQDLTEQSGENFVYTIEDIEAIYDNILNPLEKEVFILSIKNQQIIVDNCKYRLKYGEYKLPKYVYSEKEDIFRDKSSIEYLRYLVLKGAKTKLIGKNFNVYKKRFDYELQIIEDMGFSDYFLIVYDFVKYAKDNGIYVGAGRGSAAGSLVCYLLNITEADPLEYNLLFERFLNKERISMPDIDIDFQDTRRDEVIKYVEEKYGKEKVAQIITYNTFQSKSAARESARILQFSEKDLKTISKMIDSNKTLEECYEQSLELKNFINQSEHNKRWFKVARSLENLPRNTSVHAAGVVISDDNDLVEYSPLEKSNVTHYLTQWTMDDIEEVGLLKIDFLGIRYLTMVESIVKEIQKYEPTFDIDKINFKDANVYKVFSEGKTEGIFQFESSGIKEKLRILKPTEFNDIVAMNALYRPGPMAQIETYVKRKHGLEEVEYLHPKLEKILKDTYGVIVYQEQIMLIAVNFAHMSLNEADNMRRAVSKKKKEDLEKYGELFVEKAICSGYSREIANKLFRLIVIFANYGFNKSHAVVYSMLAYKLAYLKVYYTKYFMTALLNNVISSENKINEYKQELNNLDIKLIKPDVNQSLVNFSVYKQDIIFALVSIKNVGYRAASEIVNERVKFGKYQDIDDFLRRMNKKVDYQATVSLVKAGALDTFGYNRATTMNKIKEYYEDTRENIDDIRFAITSISGLTLKTEEIEDYTIYEKIAMEKEVTGTYFLKHPVQLEKEKYYYLPLSYMSDKESDSYVEIINVKEIKTKKGEYMAFLTVNDGKSDKDVTVFPNVYKYVKALLKNNKFLVLSSTPQIRNDRLQYILEKVATLENYKEYCLNNIKQIYVLVDNDNREFVKNNIVANGSTKLICFFKDKNIKNKITSIENAHYFVRKYIEHFSGKPIKISYTSK